MRFGTIVSRSAAVEHEFLKIGGDLGEQRGGQARGHRDDAGEDGHQPLDRPDFRRQKSIIAPGARQKAVLKKSRSHISIM